MAQDSETGKPIAITVALITLAGTLLVAIVSGVLTNWDKLFYGTSRTVKDAETITTRSGQNYTKKDQEPKGVVDLTPAGKSNDNNPLVLEKSSFEFPDDGVSMNNARIGPFCCTGHIAIVNSKEGNPIGYIHFLSWDGQAYQITSYGFMSTLKRSEVSALDETKHPHAVQASDNIM
jgi:hypothetical protein